MLVDLVTFRTLNRSACNRPRLNARFGIDLENPGHGNVRNGTAGGAGAGPVLKMNVGPPYPLYKAKLEVVAEPYLGRYRVWTFENLCDGLVDERHFPIPQTGRVQVVLTGERTFDVEYRDVGPADNRQLLGFFCAMKDGLEVSELSTPK